MSPLQNPAATITEPVLLETELQDAIRVFSLRSETPFLDAQVLISKLLGKPRSWILAHPEFPLSPKEHTGLADALVEIAQGIPLPYILKEWEFYGLPFTISPDVLIPRPETELLVETALTMLEMQSGSLRVADVGTGSGAIAISLAVKAPRHHYYASDISFRALQICKKNALRHGVLSQLSFIQADLLDYTSGKFDLVCANLPYIPAKRLPGLEVARQEPVIALDGGSDGLLFINRLMQQAPLFLSPRGWLLMEIDASQGKILKELAARTIGPAEVTILKDLAGNDRLLKIVV